MTEVNPETGAGEAREPQWAAWLAVGVWSGVVFATVPLARDLQALVSEHLGREVFAHLVIAITVAAAALGLRHVVRRGPIHAASALWLLAVSAVFVGFTVHLRAAPEEALHFVEYGVLGLLVWRALHHRLRDPGIYLAAALLTALVGTLDEALQWATPGRVWDLRDIGLNALAGALAQVAIAKGLRPRSIAGRPTARSLRVACRLALAVTLLLGASLLNTPERIAWYGARVPGLAYLKLKKSPMFEYGYMHEHPDIGRFRSRFTTDELRRIDAERGEEAGRILDDFPDRESYAEFLRRYTPVSDPFLHEARVHLYSRDYHFAEADRSEPGGERYRFHLSVTWCEQRILEEYFSRTLAHSSYRIPDERHAQLEQDRLRDFERTSFVSRELATDVSEGHVAGSFAAILLGLVGLDRYLGRRGTPRGAGA